MDEIFRDLESLTYGLRDQLEPLENGGVRILESTRSGVQTDKTQERISCLKKWIAENESMLRRMKESG